jgi:hypothetical protein
MQECAIKSQTCSARGAIVAFKHALGYQARNIILHHRTLERFLESCVSMFAGKHAGGLPNQASREVAAGNVEISTIGSSFCVTGVGGSPNQWGYVLETSTRR